MVFSILFIRFCESVATYEIYGAGGARFGQKMELLVGSNVDAHLTVRISANVNPKGESLREYFMVQDLLV